MLVALANFYIFDGFKQDLIEIGAAESTKITSLLEYQESTFLLALVIISLIQFSFVFVIGVFVTHKIAGPILRLKRHLKESAEGNIKELKFREKDYFQEVPVLFNELLKKKGLL